MATANAVQGYYKTVVTWTIAGDKICKIVVTWTIAGDKICKISYTIDIHDIQCMQTFY
jgi:hypothetical protein